ncbi:hypothetical protein F2P81_020010 [Scophthalmus maximus]|uniref:E3 ubiquitin-protein ligase TRIM39-like n=1 Tax=Scophthalmus maximus TaxID=52904 RepID=A0A6A4S435_SCOMX|nr:hypothetical protein F2P81_020010 [Scophthalmus maximus]
MGTVEETLKCPVCQDFFTDPVTLQCGDDFCLTCIQAVWETDGLNEGPTFCPECQIFLPSDLTLEINSSLQTKVKDFTTNRLSTAPLQATSPSREPKSPSTIHCDHCIETPSVAVSTCLTCDASLCQAHTLLHKQRSVLREHTVVEVTGDPLSLKCREHRDELKLFCMEERVPVCCLCVLVGVHKNHKASQLHEACAHFKGMLETTMNQLLKRRSEAELAIKDVESLYTQTVKSAADFRERISDKYNRIRVVLDDLSSPALDSKTAHPKLEIAPDGKQVHWRRLPALEALSLQPYDSQYSVLAQESFASGQHYWEIIVQEKPYWLIGVTTGPVKKDGPSQSSSSLRVNNTSWCIYHEDGQYLVLHDTLEKQLAVRKRVRKLGILTNFQKGELSFYDADAMTLLHTFCVQCTEPLYPMLNPCIDVNGLNRQPLTLFRIEDPWEWHVNTDGYKE